MVKKYCSIDIFDTVITRLTMHPEDVFFYMQSYLIDNYHNKYPDEFLHKFPYIRIWSEYNTRKRIQKEDITIFDIYNTIGRSYQLFKEQVSELIETELSIEASLIRPLSGINDILNKFRDDGEILFLSDSYFPSNFLKNILLRTGIAMKGEKIFVSGEIGKTKCSGTLFKYVSNELKISFSEMSHMGDNIWSDYLVPKSLGINVLENKLFPREPLNSKFKLLGYRFKKIRTLFKSYIEIKL